jgi:hypothetical protein
MSEDCASRLSELLEASRPELQAAVAEARRRVEQLRSKRDVLKAQSFGDPTALGPAEGDVDRLPDPLTVRSAVDDEFARLKAEIQAGASPGGLLADDAGTAQPAEARRVADGDGEAAPG